MGDVGVKAQANLFLNYDGGPFHANAALRQTLAGRRGTELDLSASYDLYADQDNLVRLVAGIAYANRDLMQTFFGVTPQQSANSGNPAYAPHVGIAGESVGLTWRHALGEHWVGTLGLGAEQLHGAAADSPLTVRRTSGVASAAIGYRF
jgi:outer membrane scaffolding protein for murein synthesis (MipA/OmpV family)